MKFLEADRKWSLPNWLAVSVMECRSVELLNRSVAHPFMILEIVSPDAAHVRIVAVVLSWHQLCGM
ncbi:MAG: hypothetical protein CMM01_11725 [Rhodopirellula sp.]|nr:hypothetical protein [Rhodopirellula sp.]OUX51216.1 MAG: hypothetical protein CBE43_04525 [Rhodopirellula sp. TMED283]